MPVIAYVLYLLLGLLQLAAIMSGLEDWIGLHWLIAAPIALFLAYMPLVGTVVGVAGAVTSWGWSWPLALSLFFGPFLLIATIALSAGSIAAIARRRGRAA